jgi:hypothetical protein
MSCVPLPATSHDPAGGRARPPVDPEGLSRPFPPKTPWSAALGPQSMSYVPCVCCRVLYHRGTQVCGEHVWGEMMRRRVTCEHFLVAVRGSLCVCMELQDRSTQHNTWCVRISQHTGWSIIIKAAHGCTTFPPHRATCRTPSHRPRHGVFCRRIHKDRYKWLIAALLLVVVQGQRARAQNSMSVWNVQLGLGSCSC